MFDALRELAEVLGVDPAGRPWREVMSDIQEAVQVLKTSHDSLNEMMYGDYVDYPDPDYSDYDYDLYDWYDQPEYYEEGLDYLQGDSD